MKSVTLNSSAKINLTLGILSKRLDGYHELDTVMQAVSVHDVIKLTKKEKGITVCTNLPYVPNDSRNTAYKAAKLFFEQTGIDGGIEISVEKNIPVAAGLAGGSSNAASVLKGMNWLFGTGLTLDELCKMGAKIGADVPFCLMGGAAHATGIGEKLEKLPKLPQCHIVIAKPPVSVSTPEAYSAWDSLGEESGKRMYGDMAQALQAQDIDMVCERMYNDFERVANVKIPAIAEYKKIMTEFGAKGTLMSGSGPSVFGIFGSQNQARKAYNELKKKCREVYICRPV